MKTLIISSLLLLSSIAIASNECQGPVVVPNYNCSNLKGDVDIRLSIMEFQTCEDGKITEMYRNVSVMRFSPNDISSVPENDIDINYAPERTYHDRSERVDDLTFIYPRSVRAKDGTDIIEIDLTNKLVPVYRGSFDKHMPGTFKIIDSKGNITKGKLSCSVFI